MRLPDPFALVSVDGEQIHTTSVIKKTLNPYWNERFDLRVNEDSVLAVQIFDQKKFKKKDQGFLGVVNIRVGNVIDLDAGGDGMNLSPRTYCCAASVNLVARSYRTNPIIRQKCSQETFIKYST